MSAVEQPEYRVGSEFNENSPRPPVPGCSEAQAPGAYNSECSSKYSNCKGGSSPVLTPRRSNLGVHATNAEAPLGFEPEGSCSSGGGGGEGGGRSPPPYLRWALNLHSLLEDQDGKELFRRYLEQEGGSYSDTLDLWLACEGLKKQDSENIVRYVNVIYKLFFVKKQLAIPEDLRKKVSSRIQDCNETNVIEINVFEGVQQEVERQINETTYPNFLHSDYYLNYVDRMMQGNAGEGVLSSSSGSSSGGQGSVAQNGPILATVYEDSELVTAGEPLPLTKEMLLATQKKRALESRPKPEAYAGVYLQHAHHYNPYHPPNPYHAYSSYNPVSRQDSELQSLSSDARTESDSMSIAESSVDGNRISRNQYIRQCKQMKESANINRDPYLHYSVIPRTQRIQKDQVQQMAPDQFAALLIEKLEAVKKEQEVQEKLNRKLQEGEGMYGVDDLDSCAPSRTLADAIREKLQVDDESDQAILDEHVSRIWSDLTPSRSPVLISPRPKSPDCSRRRSAVPLNKLLGGTGSLHLSASGMNPASNLINLNRQNYPYGSRQTHYQRHTHKDKEVLSIFSSDSGNVYDFPEDTDYKYHLPKSKSVPDYYQDPQQKADLYLLSSGHDAKFRQGRDACRRSSSKKILTDDSGVSVVSSEAPPIIAGLPAAVNKDRVYSWLIESVKQGSGSSHSHSEREAATSSSKHKLRGSATSPNALRHGRKASVVYNGSRSGSLERGSSGVQPSQPFIADPLMPPLPIPHTSTQLEEARRRLIEEEGRSKNRQRLSGKGTWESPMSGQSTLRKLQGPSCIGARPLLPGVGASGESSEYTTVVFSFCNEKFPYRTKIPANPVTLRMFKEYLPKKGSYRFFFKTECDDVDTKAIQEEIMDDNEILPLWEGKIMAQVKPID